MLFGMSVRKCAAGYVSWFGCEEVCSWACQLVGLAVRKCAVGYDS